MHNWWNQPESNHPIFIYNNVIYYVYVTIFTPMLLPKYQKVMRVVLDEMPKVHPGSIEKFKERQYKVADAGISHRVLTHWKKEGLFVPPNSPGTYLKLNAIELSWLSLLQQLRQFGIPIKTLKHLRNNLMPEVEASQVAAIPEFKQLFKGVFGGATSQISTALEITGNIRLNFFEQLYIMHHTHQDDLSLFISSEGHCVPFLPGLEKQLTSMEAFREVTEDHHLVIKMNRL